MIQQFHATVSGALFLMGAASTSFWQNELWYYVVTRHLHPQNVMASSWTGTRRLHTALCGQGNFKKVAKKLTNDNTFDHPTSSTLATLHVYFENYFISFFSR